GCSVNGSTCSYFNKITQYHIAGLRNFLISAVLIRRESKTISSNYTSTMDNTIIPYNSLRLDLCTRKNHDIITDFAIITYIYIGINFDVFSQNHIFSYMSKGSNIMICTIART